MADVISYLSIRIVEWFDEELISLCWTQLDCYYLLVGVRRKKSSSSVYHLWWSLRLTSFGLFIWGFRRISPRCLIVGCRMGWRLNSFLFMIRLFKFINLFIFWIHKFHSSIYILVKLSWLPYLQQMTLTEIMEKFYSRRSLFYLYVHSFLYSMFSA